MRFLPRSLFGRLVLLVAALLVVAQFASLALHMHERGEMLLQASGMRAAQRVADIVQLFDTLTPEDRVRIARVLSVPPLAVRIDSRESQRLAQASGAGARAALFASMLRRFLGEERAVRVELSAVDSVAANWSRLHAGMSKSGMHGEGPFGPGVGYLNQPGVAFVAQVALKDGAVVTVESRQPLQTSSWPYRLVWSIAIVLIAAVAIAWIAVRWATQPLHTLATAAEELGRNVNRAPLAETGPTEVARAAHAFNTMQSQVKEYLDSRTRLLAAMSHDLKTPITRLRLRSELLDDAKLRERYEQDLGELESMVTATLDFLRGIQNEEPVQAFDVSAMLEVLAADLKETGAEIGIEGQVARPYVGQRRAMRRCVGNLMDNAIEYGIRARIVIDDDERQLLIRVLDNGPGIPPAELEKVFEPFYRIDASRGRHSGGTGLGLAIARQIARAHGGEVTLHNRPEGGLEARLVLPREPAASDPIGRIASTLRSK